MSGFLSKLFGGKKKSGESESEAKVLIRECLEGLIEKSNLNIEFEISELEPNGETKEFMVQVQGQDQALFTERDGQLLDAIQLFLKRVLQHRLAEERINIGLDCQGFREESNKSLVELAEKLKEVALEKGKSVYFRALSPKDRKVIHQYLATDDRVKSRSIGEGLYKKIKIFPVKMAEGDGANTYGDSLD